jgi:hypothetical protein
VQQAAKMAEEVFCAHGLHGIPGDRPGALPGPSLVSHRATRRVRAQGDPMIQETIARIEARLRATKGVQDPSRAEVLQLLATLKAEIEELENTHEEHARSIAGFAQVSAHEATRPDRKPRLLDLSLQGLRSSVEGFETSHPRLVQAVNAICNALANLGI